MCSRGGNDVVRPLKSWTIPFAIYYWKHAQEHKPSNILLLLPLVAKFTDSNYIFRDWSSMDWERSRLGFIDWYYRKKIFFAYEGYTWPVSVLLNCHSTPLVAKYACIAYPARSTRVSLGSHVHANPEFFFKKKKRKTLKSLQPAAQHWYMYGFEAKEIILYHRSK